MGFLAKYMLKTGVVKRQNNTTNTLVKSIVDTRTLNTSPNNRALSPNSISGIVLG
jgi:hypothetical protein